jgi:hypothetical protein
MDLPGENPLIRKCLRVSRTTRFSAPPFAFLGSVAGTGSDAQGNSRIEIVLRKLDYRSTEGSGAKGDFNQCYYKSLVSWKLKKPPANDDVIQEMDLKNLRSRRNAVGEL